MPPTHRARGQSPLDRRRGRRGGAPDITAVTVANDENGVLSFRIAVSNRTGLVLGETAVIFIDSDERRDTGTSEVFGADVQLVLNDDGGFLMRRWDESTMSFSPAAPPPASLTAGWFDGYRFSIALSDLRSPRRIEFAAGTRTTAGGAVARDQLNGRYDTHTGVGEALDPFGEIPPATNPPAASKPPAAPRGVAVSHARWSRPSSRHHDRHELP